MWWRVWRRTSSLMTEGTKPSLDGEKNPNQAQMNLMLDGIVVEQDGVIAVRDFVAMVVAVTTVGSAE
ncbi:hypothetical protein HKD37_07G017827 [Glycine soja]